jgi:hypothetical protein
MVPEPADEFISDLAVVTQVGFFQPLDGLEGQPGMRELFHESLPSLEGIMEIQFLW